MTSTEALEKYKNGLRQMEKAERDKISEKDYESLFDNICDQMDYYWTQMSEEDRTTARKFSSDLRKGLVE